MDNFKKQCWLNRAVSEGVSEHQAITVLKAFDRFSWEQFKTWWRNLDEGALKALRKDFAKKKALALKRRAYKLRRQGG